MHIKQKIKNFYFPPSFSIIISFIFQLHDWKTSLLPYFAFLWLQSGCTFFSVYMTFTLLYQPGLYYPFWQGTASLLSNVPMDCMCTKPFQSQPILWDHMDYRLPGSSVHGILQARILEWVAMTISRNWHAKYFLLLLLLFSCSVVPALWDPRDCSTPGFPVLHHLPELVQTHVHWVSDAI